MAFHVPFLYLYRSQNNSCLTVFITKGKIFFHVSILSLVHSGNGYTYVRLSYIQDSTYRPLIRTTLLFWFFVSIRTYGIINRGMNNDAYCFKKYHPPIHHRQIWPCYIHTSNLVRKIPNTIRLLEGVLNRLLCTQSCIDSLKPIQAGPQYITNKCMKVRRLNL